MATGACGINCDVCRLYLRGVCSTCGPGRSAAAGIKLETQVRLLGTPCPILSCAAGQRVDHCMRDCHDFPCEKFRLGPYPFSAAYLDMQSRRLREKAAPRTPSGQEVRVPEEYWTEIERADISRICQNAGAKHSRQGILLPFLKEYLLIDPNSRRMFRQGHSDWEPAENPLLEILSLVYLLGADPSGVTGDMVSVKELKNARFFCPPHELKIAPLLARYGQDMEGFKKAATVLSGEPLDLAAASYKVIAFPKVPLYYLLWEGDSEFSPSANILFDRSIERHLAADAIWGLVNLVTDLLVLGERWID